jgi:hypothetical protein
MALKNEYGATRNNQHDMNWSLTNGRQKLRCYRRDARRMVRRTVRRTARDHLDGHDRKVEDIK